MTRVVEILETYYDAAPRPSATTEEIGPFTLFRRLDDACWPYYARPRLGVTASVTDSDVDAVRARQRQVGIPESLEWVHDVTPSLLESARASGMTVEECPLMVLERLDVPVLDAPVEIHVLTADDPRVAGVTAAVDAGFKDTDELDRDDPRLRVDIRTSMMRRGLLATAGAFAAGSPVGGGSHGPRDATTEITGVAVLPRVRRRGVGAAVTAALVADAKERGVHTVFLSAQSDAVARVYGRIGFRRVGTACTAVPDPTAN